MLKLCVRVFVCGYMHMSTGYAWKSEEGVRPSGAVVTGSVSNQISESCVSTQVKGYPQCACIIL